MSDTANKIYIICDGKEISYGQSLQHLFSYKDEDNIYFSSVGEIYKPEIYSIATFRHTSVSKKSYKIYVGSAGQGNKSKEIFNRFGMKINKKDNVLIITADTDETLINKQADFISFANSKRQEYLELEKDYVSRISVDWLPGQFAISEKSKGLFNRRSSKDSVQQLYDCLGFVVYMDVVRVFG